MKLNRYIRNVLYFFKRIKEVGSSGDKIYYKCLKCNTDLIGYKNYGKLHIACKCGNVATVYTGKSYHFIVQTKKTKESNKERKREFFIPLLFVIHVFSFIAWVVFYSFYHDYIRYFMFDVVGVRMYYRVITMFIMYAIISSPISGLIWFLSRTESIK